jgi:uncharacterized protein
MTVGIFGSNGFIGSEISNFLCRKFIIVAFRRFDLLRSDQELADRVKECDIIINLVGSPIIRRWTRNGLKEIWESRIDVTEKIVKAILIAEKRPSLLINCSAIGVYTTGPVHDEYSDIFDTGFIGSLIREWELRAFKAKDLGVRVIIARLGIVVGREGGLLNQLLPFFKWGLGGRIGDGKSIISFIGIHDLCRAMEFLIENEKLEGIFNFTCPSYIDNNKFTIELTDILKKRARLQIPVVALKLALGRGSEVVLNGQKALPKRLLDEGFIFKQPEIREILEFELLNIHG